LPCLRYGYSDPAGSGTGFFIPSGRHPLSDVFFLAYGGLHWSYGDVMTMPTHVRRSFVEMLETQLEHERKEMERKK